MDYIKGPFFSYVHAYVYTNVYIYTSLLAAPYGGRVVNIIFTKVLKSVFLPLGVNIEFT